MEKLERLRNKKLATGLAIIAGAVGLTACGSEGSSEELSGSYFKNNLYVSSYDEPHEDYREGYVEVDDYDLGPVLDDHNAEIHAYCEGKTLRKSFVAVSKETGIAQNNNWAVAKREALQQLLTRYMQHPACDDENLEKSDKFTKDRVILDAYSRKGEFNNGVYCVPNCEATEKYDRDLHLYNSSLPVPAKLSCSDYDASIYVDERVMKDSIFSWRRNDITYDNHRDNTTPLLEDRMDAACQDRQITPSDKPIILPIMQHF